MSHSYQLEIVDEKSVKINLSFLRPASKVIEPASKLERSYINSDNKYLIEQYEHYQAFLYKNEDKVHGKDDDLNV